MPLLCACNKREIDVGRCLEGGVRASDASPPPPLCVFLWLFASSGDWDDGSAVGSGGGPEALSTRAIRTEQGLIELAQWKTLLEAGSVPCVGEGERRTSHFLECAVSLWTMTTSIIFSILALSWCLFVWLRCISCAS